MVDALGSFGEILYISRREVEDLNTSMEKVIEAVEKAFFEKARGKVEDPPKPGIHPQRNAFIHAMPAYLSETRVAGIKWVSGSQKTRGRGYPISLV